MAIGVLTRATLVTAVYKQTLSMTVEARSAHPSGKITTLVSSDVRPFEYALLVLIIRSPE
jgi:hypothetical protein